VVVADDSETVREVVGNMLEIMGLRVDTVASGAACLEKLAQASENTRYDLAILDWKMPGMDGIELAEKIRSLGGEPCPRILMITGYGYDDMKTAAGELRVDGWLEKPFTLAMLFTAVQKALGVNMPGALQPPQIEAPQVPPALLRGARVLVVEDNELNRLVAGEILTGAGVLVSYAANGIEALAAMKEARFDAVLMDIQMPLMDGYTATRQMRAWEVKVKRKKRLSIIAMTAHAMRHEHAISIEAGMDDHLTKPINAVDMLAVLVRWVQGGREPVGDSARIMPSPAGGDAARAGIYGINAASAIARIDGNFDLYLKIVKLFKNNVPKPDAIIELFRRGEHDAARREAHTAKGMSAQIGAERLQGNAAGLEESIQAGDREAFEKQAVLYAAELKKVVLSVDQFIHCSDEHPN
jgi:two-component system sensor histidine kinase/response regulator